MTDLTLLKDKIRESGLMKKAVAEKSGIRYATLDRRLKGLGEFTASEIMGICKALDLKSADRNAIFFKEERE